MKIGTEKSLMDVCESMLKRAINEIGGVFEKDILPIQCFSVSKNRTHYFVRTDNYSQTKKKRIISSTITETIPRIRGGLNARILAVL
jgi:hypothetical protein